MDNTGYIINVAKFSKTTEFGDRYTHYCRINIGEGFEDMAREKATDISKRFPESEGFKVTMSHYQLSGKTVLFPKESGGFDPSKEDSR